jgi:RNA polymerase sigma-32 factor
MSRTRRTSLRFDARSLPRAFAGQPPLDPDVEQELTRRYQETGDPAIGHRLVRANLRLVLSIAGEYAARSGADLEDLIQEGSLGLVEGVRRFDPGRGVRLMTYAGFWVRAHVLRHILDTSRLVRPGRSRASRAAFFRGERPAVELSLQSTGSLSESAELLSERLTDDQAIPADQALERAELARLFASEAAAFTRDLGPREAAIFRERLLRAEPLPLARIAHRYSVSKERIRQIERSLSDSFQARLAARLQPAPAETTTADSPADQDDLLAQAA